MGSNDWLTSPPVGQNRPKSVAKRTLSSYYQGSPEGDPDMTKAIESKMHQPEDRFNNLMTVEDMINAIPTGHNDYTSRRIMNQLRDAQGVLRQLPDISLAANIVVSAITNAGLQTYNITYSSDLEKLLGGVAEPLLKKVDQAMEDAFSLKKVLPRWIHKALIEEGAVAINILPETTIDAVVNSDLVVGLNEYATHTTQVSNHEYGVLGKGDESLDWPAAEVAGLNSDDKAANTNGYNKLYHRFSDNPEMLKLSRLKKRQIEDKFTELYLQKYANYGGYKVGLNDDAEANPFAAAIRDQKTGKVNLKNSYHRNRTYKAKPVDMLRDPSTLERKNIGWAVPTIMPKEAIIPLFDPSDPTTHIAFLCLLDENNKPVSRLSASAITRNDYQGMAQEGSLPSMFIRQADQSMSMTTNSPGGDSRNEASKYMDFQSAFDLYTTIVWNDWSKRIENGVLGTSYNVGKVDSIMKLLFDMTLRKKQCQILVIPESLMTYMAYNYDDVGVGESLIEISKSLASLRITLLYTQTNMEYQASIPRRRLNMKIDPREPDKQAAVRMLYNNWILNQHTALPIGIIDPVSINQSIWRQAVEVNVESDPRYPNTTLNVEPIQFDKREPDAALSERLQKLHNMGFGLTPEQIDTSLGDDRVTSRLLNNEMFRQRITTWKDITDYHLTDLTRKYILNSQPIMDDIRNAIKVNNEKILKTVQDGSDSKAQTIDVDRIAHNFVMGITANLPSIEEEGLDDTETKFTAYADFLDKLLDSQFSPEVFQSGQENVRIEDLKLLKQLVKAELIRDWLNERGVLPDVVSLTSVTEGKKNISPLINRAVEWLKSLSPVLTDVLTQLRGVNDSIAGEVPARGGEVGQETGGYGGGVDMDGQTDPNEPTDPFEVDEPEPEPEPEPTPEDDGDGDSKDKKDDEE